MKFFFQRNTGTDQEDPYEAAKQVDFASALSAEQLTAMADIEALLELSAPRFAENDNCDPSLTSYSAAE